LPDEPCRTVTNFSKPRSPDPEILNLTKQTTSQSNLADSVHLPCPVDEAAIEGRAVDSAIDLSQTETTVSAIRTKHASWPISSLEIISLSPKPIPYYGLIQTVPACSLLRLGAKLVSNGIENLGLIAGNRTLPLVLAQHARRHGVQRLVAVGFEGETDPSLASMVDEMVWVKVGQLSRMIGAFTSRGIRQCVMAGQIAPKNLYAVRPDLRAMGVLLRLKERNAHSIFGAIADELKKDGVELIEATPWLKDLMPGREFCLGPKVSREQKQDLEFGFRIAKATSQLEIGQSVVVKRGTVLAVEAFEGTDDCLARGGELAGKEGGAVAVKVARQNHDFRFDIPCIGLQTLETCARAGIAVLAVESGKTLLLQQEACEELARKNKISITTVA
jgi:UDP-2,3-diacylglucosamine hydrolase